MAAALLIAGVIQSQLWYVAGLKAGETNRLLFPWLVLRLIGGLAYTLGSSVLTFVVVKKAWKNLRFFFPSLKELEQRQRYRLELQDLRNGMQQLIITGSKMEQILQNIKLLLDKTAK